MLTTARSSTTTQLLLASNLPWSWKIFTILPGCCPLRTTPFSNFIRMRTRCLVLRPKTTVIDTMQVRRCIQLLTYSYPKNILTAYSKAGMAVWCLCWPGTQKHFLFVGRYYFSQHYLRFGMMILLPYQPDLNFPYHHIWPVRSPLTVW